LKEGPVQESGDDVRARVYRRWRGEFLGKKGSGVRLKMREKNEQRSLGEMGGMERG